jgi:phosphate-selective porin
MIKLKQLAIKLLFIWGLGLLGITQSYSQVVDLETLMQLDEDTSKLEILTGLKVSGYFQGQFQYGQKDADLGVGAPNTDVTENFNRIGIRRGRLKFTYEKRIALAVLQFDMTETSIRVKDAYMQFNDLKYSQSSLKVGAFYRPFGYEVSHSSSLRESPERAHVITTLFPEERDLGVMLTLQAKKSSAWSIFKIDAGLFAGNGVKADIKNKKDFIGRFSINKSFKDYLGISGGVSYYNGHVYQGTTDVYSMYDKIFIPNSSMANIGKYAKREYIGVNAKIVAITKLGMSSITGEFIAGVQPGRKDGSKSPNSSTVGSTDTYIRDFYGAYACLVQDFGKLPLSAVVKYEWYDPNNKVSKDEIGLFGTGIGDVSYNTLGFGLIWKVNPDIRATVYYEMAKNEISQNLSNFENDIENNIFTLRLQYKF